MLRNFFFYLIISFLFVKYIIIKKNYTLIISYHIFQHYIFDTDISIHPQLNYQDNSENMLRQLQNQLQTLQNNSIANISNISNSLNINNQIYLPTNSWIPSQKFNKLLNTFKTSILNQFICASCAFCRHLIYPEKCE